LSETQIVYVVDDDAAVRESLGVLLEASGFSVSEFSSGDDFLDQLVDVKSGCLITDVRMPGLSGLEVHQELIKREIALPVIIISGHGDLPMAVKAMKAGAVDFIEKPFAAALLCESVGNAMDKSAASQQEASAVAEISQRLVRLTERERQVLDELVVGNLNKVIAYNLSISPRTVEIHRARVMEKMQARNLAHLVRLAITVGSMPASPSES
jgi:two-component system response regulator FixJ